MKTDLPIILDECIRRVSNGEDVEACLAESKNVREQVEPLLNTALVISALPRAGPSDEFRRTSRDRLMARLRLDAVQVESTKPEGAVSFLDGLDAAWQGLWRALIGARRVVVPVTLAVLLAIGASFGIFNSLSTSPALASQCTLSLLSGSAEVQRPDSGKWQQGDDGMTLAEGTRIRTTRDSHALLTFFEGSTVKLEPGTEIEIKQVMSSDGQPTTIVLKQWMGKTWNRVVKMPGSGSRYEIETPSASAIVRGTLFTTEVDNNGATRVATTEGLVSVVAKGEEVYLPPREQTEVLAGAAPSQPLATPPTRAELIVKVDSPAVASVKDPTGASTGYLPNGQSFNQIPDSRSSSPSDGTQVVTITEPESGEYIIALRYVRAGIAQFSIRGISAGEVSFQYAGTYGEKADSGWLIRLNLLVVDGFIVAGEISGAESLDSGAPTKSARASGITVAEGIVPAEMPSPFAGMVQDEEQSPAESRDNSNVTEPAQSQERSEDSSSVAEVVQGEEGGHGKSPARDEDVSRGKDDSGKPARDEGVSQGKDDSGKPSRDEGVSRDKDDSGKPARDEDISRGKDDNGKPASDEDISRGKDDSGKPAQEEGQDKGKDIDRDKKGNRDTAEEE